MVELGTVAEDLGTNRLHQVVVVPMEAGVVVLEGVKAPVRILLLTLLSTFNCPQERGVMLIMRVLMMGSTKAVGEGGSWLMVMVQLPLSNIARGMVVGVVGLVKQVLQGMPFQG